MCTTYECEYTCIMYDFYEYFNLELEPDNYVYRDDAYVLHLGMMFYLQVI